MNNNLFRGNLIRLGAETPETLADVFSRWGRDSEYIRLLDNDPARQWSKAKWKEWIEKELDDTSSKSTFFSIRTLEDDRLIGFIDLFGGEPNHGDSWVGIGLGERDYWGKGYGTEAMNLVLGYAFTELNLHRVTLGVFEYNSRAIRSYEKAGFKPEGLIRQTLQRDGRRWDMLMMGILRSEWEQNHKTA